MPVKKKDGRASNRKSGKDFSKGDLRLFGKEGQYPAS